MKQSRVYRSWFKDASLLSRTLFMVAFFTELVKTGCDEFKGKS